MLQLIYVMLGGAAGTGLRYGLGRWVSDNARHGFPWGTLLVNLAGCFLFGLAWSLVEKSSEVSPTLRVAVLTGFMGGFTTFSSFIHETRLLNQSNGWLAIANIALEIILGLVALYLGVRGGESLIAAR